MSFPKLSFYEKFSRTLVLQNTTLTITFDYQYTRRRLKYSRAGCCSVRPSEAVVQRYSVKKVFLEISQNSQENTCARVSFLNKVAGLRPATLLRKRLWHWCFHVNFAKFLGTLFLTEHLVAASGH